MVRGKTRKTLLKGRGSVTPLRKKSGKIRTHWFERRAPSTKIHGVYKKRGTQRKIRAIKFPSRRH